MNYDAIDFLDWEVLPSIGTDWGGDDLKWTEGDWLAYYRGVLVGRVMEVQKWEASTEGELPFVEIGKFDSLREARLALALAVADRAKTVHIG